MARKRDSKGRFVKSSSSSKKRKTRDAAQAPLGSASRLQPTRCEAPGVPGPGRCRGRSSAAARPLHVTAAAIAWATSPARSSR